MKNEKAIKTIVLLTATIVLGQISCAPSSKRRAQKRLDARTKQRISALDSNSSPNQSDVVAVNTPRDWSCEKERIAEKIRRLLKPELRPTTDPAAAQDYYLDQRLPAGSQVLPLEQLRTALENIKRRERQLALQRGAGAMGNWAELGPGNIGGRTRAIVINPVDPDVMYAGGVAGGVWKSNDAGGSWAPTDDLMLNLAISTLVMDPTNPDILYAGTGEGFRTLSPTGETTMKRGLGIFKTDDAGATWTQLLGTVTGVPTGAFYTVNQIVISPADSSRIYAATRFGVWKSGDSGTSWSLMLHNPNELADASPATNGSSVGCLDLAIRSDTAPGSDTLLAAFGSFNPDGVFRSTDSGVSWTQVGTSNDLIRSNQGRMEIAIAPSNNDIMYVAMADNGRGNLPGVVVDVFRSTDGGLTWSPRLDLASPLNQSLFSNTAVGGACGGQIISAQGWFDNVIQVDPLDSDMVWVGGIDLFRSDDGAQNFQIASYWFIGGLGPNTDPNYVHADQHALTFHPNYDGTTNQTLFSGSDGGIARTDNARSTTSPDGCFGAATLPGITWTGLNNGYGVTQFYHGDSARKTDIFAGGTQDNGTPLVKSATTPDDWKEVIGGDGGYFNIDPTNSQIMYGESQRFPTIQKSIDGGDTFFLATFGITDADGLFITPVVLDQSSPSILWSGGRRPWRTVDGAASWTAAGTGFANNGTISAIAVAPSDSSIVYLGFNSGFVAKSTDALVALPTWTEFAAPNGLNPGAHISSLAVDPVDPAIAYCTYSTFGVPHILRTIDGGQSWVSIDGPAATGVPDIPVHWLAVRPCKPDQLFVGTELGVFRSDDNGTSWDPFNTGFANVVVETLDFQSDHQLVAFSHGRGAFRTPLDCPCDPTSPFIDCNSNAERDECDIADGTSSDCNENGIPDECDLADGVTLDCNANNVPDECDADCNANDIPDECDITAGTSHDCDASGIPDECENDCNNNGFEDSCDIANGDSADDDGDGIPDECVGACCVCPDCIETSALQCAAQQGDFTALGVTCAESGCLGGNDDCANAILLPSDNEITVRFDNRCSTDDGPSTIVCDTGSQPFTTDIWFDYVAPCCGTLTVSLCGVPFDGILSLHGGSEACACPLDNSTMVACGDDTCGTVAGPPFASSKVIEGGCYKIRAGGWSGATGVGDLEISMVCGRLAEFSVLGTRDFDIGDGGLSGVGHGDVWADGDIVFLGQARGTPQNNIPGFDDKVHFIDISDPSNFDRFLEWQVPGDNSFAATEDVQVDSGLLFVSLFGGGVDGVEIVDVRDPFNPAHLSFVTVPGFEDVKNSFYDNGYLYLANGTTAQLAVVDLTSYDPDNPPGLVDQALWILNVGLSHVHDVTVQDDVLYAAAWNSGLFVFDISNIAMEAPALLGSGPALLNTSTAWPSDDGRWVVATELRDRGPARLYEIVPNGGGVDVLLRDTVESRKGSTGFFASAFNAVVVGKRAYVTWNEEGLQVFDIDADTAKLVHVQTYESFAHGSARGGFFGAWGVFPLQGEDRILVSDVNTGLHVVRLSEKPLSISYPDGRARLIDPDDGAVFPVEISPDCADVDPATTSVFVRNDVEGGGFVELPLTPLGSNMYEAAIPGGACLSRTDYYIRTVTLGGVEVVDPPGAPEDFYIADVGKVLVGLLDDFETDTGWISSSDNCPTATDIGVWERVDPNGTGIAPEDDFTEGDGTMCYVTSQGPVGGTFFANDVDGGPFRLTSPTIAIGWQDARIRYARWFKGQWFSAGPINVLEIEASGDGGQSWVPVETVVTGHGTQWKPEYMKVSDIMPPTETITLRFTAADCPGTSVSESAIDEVGMYTVLCSEFIPNAPTAAPPLHNFRKNRYLSFAPNNADTEVAVRVTLTDSLNHPDAVGAFMWVDEPNADGIASVSATPVLRQWPEEVVHVTGCFVSPVASYEIRAVISDVVLSDPLSIDTIDQPGAGVFWGDVVGSFDGMEWNPPQGVTNIDDAFATIQTFQQVDSSPHVSVTDVEPQFINSVVNINDVFQVLLAFQGQPYPFGCPTDPCQDNILNPCP